MLTLKNGTNVRIVEETNLVVKVVEINPCGFTVNGDQMFQTYTLSKKHHKGSLLLDGTPIL
ncbi:hypothetical protein KUA24_5 [Vibrio phage HNL01]|nr:hypothetical protein KUA24_5 [Vibrio phage HNL01]